MRPFNLAERVWIPDRQAYGRVTGTLEDTRYPRSYLFKLQGMHYRCKTAPALNQDQVVQDKVRSHNTSIPTFTAAVEHKRPPCSPKERKEGTTRQRDHGQTARMSSNQDGEDGNQELGEGIV
ncbi:hypothetical protein PR048_010854 [Dryococelus australis]|uniref:Uncharacterized protein n=1 Tax=Dryococelus australis TaxID=614101 RepID=A0ABQ9I5T8_9NEOP|nr:hypothetical protein PR048_010854 [Dryococelus australis]